MGNLLRALLPLAALGAILAACGSSSTTSPTAITSVTSAATLSPPNFTGPVLNVTQLGFKMTFPQQLGTVNYLIDSTGAGPMTDNNGVHARFVGYVNLFTSLYAAACSPQGSTTTAGTTTTHATTATVATTTTTTASSPPPGVAAAPSVVEAQIAVYDNTNAARLNLGVGGVPDAWTRAGKLLLGFRGPQTFPSCGSTQLKLDLPLLRQMFGTARPG